MPSKEEKRRRAKLVEAEVEKDTAAAISRMPISIANLTALFDYLDVHLAKEDCDHTTRMTHSFLASRNLSVDSIVPWLEDHGGFCDCEVLANVEESWGDQTANYT